MADGVRLGKLELTWSELAQRTLSYEQFYALRQLLYDELSDDEGARVIVDRNNATGQVSVAVVPRIRGGDDTLVVTVRIMIEEFVRALE